MEKVNGYLRKYEGLFPEKAQEILNKVREGISDSDRDYVGTVKEYALAAHNLVTPVNIWRIPYPRGHAAVFASPTRLSLVTGGSNVRFRDHLFTGGQHTVCMCIHINTIEFVMKINDSVQGRLNSRAICLFAAFCSSA